LELRQHQRHGHHPWYKTELDIAAPPYIQHNSTAKDGFGDLSMLLKYRVSQ
jgi:hypothetical protein